MRNCACRLCCVLALARLNGLYRCSRGSRFVMRCIKFCVSIISDRHPLAWH